MLRIHTFHTPFHDMLFLIGLMLSTILISLRLENVISVKYSLLLIPALISLFSFLVSSKYFSWSNFEALHAIISIPKYYETLKKAYHSSSFLYPGMILEDG